MTTARLSISEFGQIQRDQVGPRAWADLQRIDERRLRAGQAAIFDWSASHRARARNLVGVVQVPGVSIEILPKVDPASDDEPAPYASSNLVYMLSLASEVPVTELESATLLPQRAHLLDVFVRAFVNELLGELSKGMQRDYTRREAELPHVKGQVVLATEATRPPWSRHRVHVRWDEYDEDTVVNRCVRAACRRLVLAVRDPGTRALLNRAVEELDFVSDILPSRRELREVVFDRASARFERTFEFARSVLLGDSPSPRAGELPSISLVFPMDRLFEAFVARSIMRLATRLDLRRDEIHRQAIGNRLWLLVDQATGRGALRLKPDLVIDRGGEKASLIIDTKWKRLLSEPSALTSGVEERDIYQAATYGYRYGARDAVLLFPRVPGFRRRQFSIPGSRLAIRIEAIGLNRDLAKTSLETLLDLRDVISNSNEGRPRDIR